MDSKVSRELFFSACFGGVFFFCSLCGGGRGGVL